MFPISTTAVGAGHARPAALRRAPARGENALASLANHVEANPRTLAAASNFPGGYGIRPYGVGVDACIDPEDLPPPQGSCGRAILAPTSVVILKLYFCFNGLVGAGHAPPATIYQNEYNGLACRGGIYAARRSRPDNAV